MLFKVAATRYRMTNLSSLDATRSRHADSDVNIFVMCTKVRRIVTNLFSQATDDAESSSHDMQFHYYLMALNIESKLVQFTNQLFWAFLRVVRGESWWKTMVLVNKSSIGKKFWMLAWAHTWTILFWIKRVRFSQSSCSSPTKVPTFKSPTCRNARGTQTP